jgi:hypothetical protein
MNQAPSTNAVALEQARLAPVPGARVTRVGM